MRLLKRLLRARHRRRGRHMDSCGECLLRQRRERQYLERLRGADVPAASDDLTARLLARTEELARAGEAEHSGGLDRPRSLTPPWEPKRTAWLGTAPPAGVRRLRPCLRSTGYVAGGAAAAAVLLGGAAYLMGAGLAPAAGGATASALLQRDLSGSGADAVEAGPGAPAGWGLTGEPDFTPAGTLTGDQLSALRAEGWSCPEFRELGYHLVWARSRVAAGGEFLELRLTDGRHFATVLEQHGVPAQQGSPGESFPADGSTQTPPLNVLTGHRATADGYTPAQAEGVAAAGILWVHSAAPFAAIYQLAGTTFTYVSDQAVDQDQDQAEDDDGVAALIRAGNTAPGAPAGEEAAPGGLPDVPARMERGLGRIVEMLLP